MRYPRYNIDPFESRSGQTKGYDIGIYCFFAKNAALRSQKKTDLLKIRILCVRVVQHIIQWLLLFLFCFVLFCFLFCFFVFLLFFFRVNFCYLFVWDFFILFFSLVCVHELRRMDRFNIIKIVLATLFLTRIFERKIKRYLVGWLRS